MAAIENDRDILLQATSPRVVPIPIPIDRIEGLPQALKSVRILSSADAFIGSGTSTTPPSITLTAERVGGLTGPVVWSIMSGTGTVTPNGDSCTVVGGSIVGQSITIRARVTEGSVNYDAQTTLTRLGTLSGQATVDLTTQTTGTINGATQVTNLGALAYTSTLYADQIGSGTFPVGVVYAGTINVNNLVGETISGKNISAGEKIYLGGSSESAPFMASFSLSGADARLNVRGATRLSSSSGNNRVWVDDIFGITLAGNTLVGGTFRINGTLDGTTGSRIILKNVVYDVKVNGTDRTTVEFI